MAKPFYSSDEVCKILKKDPDGVKALVREGALREYRDAGKVFYKAEDVDKLAGGGASNRSGTGEIVLEPAEEELPSLADSRGGTSIIGLAPSEDDSPKKDDTVISASGIGVFDDDELEIDADPMAKTQITQEAVSDAVTLEGTGSGSGLLDLTREADDTSLGAELLDEIYPGEDQPAAPPPTRKAAAAKPPPPPPEPEPVEAGEAIEVVRPVATGDPAEGMFGGLLVGTVVMLAVAGTVVSGVLQGNLPGYAQWLSNNFLIFLGGGVGVMVVSLLLGWVLGNATATRR